MVFAGTSRVTIDPKPTIALSPMLHLLLTMAPGAIQAPSAYFMKSPPVQYTDDEARQMVELFAGGEMNPENNFTPRKFSGVADVQQVAGD